MEPAVAITLIVINTIALVVHIAASDSGYRQGEEVFLFSIAGLFFAIGSVLSTVIFGVSSEALGTIIWFSAVANMVFFLIGPMNAASGQG